MEEIELRPIGRKVSCLGFGCSRLDGRVGLRQSTKLLETALDLGITYFDVAASYGTAEEALGHVIGNSSEVVIATKVGPPRQPYNATKTRMRFLAKSLLDQFRGIKMLVGGLVGPRPHSAGRPRYDFSQQTIERSLGESLQRLKRDQVDIFLAHEPHRDDLTPEVAARFESLIRQNLIRAFGVGIGAAEDRWAQFGTFWQSGWPGERATDYSADVSYIFHSIFRFAEKDRHGRCVYPVTTLIREARRIRPDTVLLVSASTPQRLREVVEAVQQAN